MAESSLRGQCHRQRSTVVTITMLVLSLLVTSSQAWDRPCPRMSPYTDFEFLQPAFNPQPQSQPGTVPNSAPAFPNSAPAFPNSAPAFPNSAPAFPNSFEPRGFPYYVQQSMTQPIPMRLGFQLPFTLQMPDYTPSNVRPRPFIRPSTPNTSPIQYRAPQNQPQRQPTSYSGQNIISNSQPSDNAPCRCTTANQSPVPESYGNAGLEPAACAQSNSAAPSEQAYQQSSNLAADDCAC